MKVAFYPTFNKNTTYTFELLKHIAKSYGHTITDIPDWDLLGVSLTSHYEIKKLRTARR